MLVTNILYMSRRQEFSAKIKVQLALASYIATIILFLAVFLNYGDLFPISLFVPLTLSFGYDLLVYYSLLVLGGFLAQFIIIQILNRRRAEGITISRGEGYTRWDYFVQEPSGSKIALLVLYLLMASFAEEVIYRYFIFQAIYFPFAIYSWVFIGVILATIISAIIFGVAHRVNGFFGYVVNSMIGGLFFGLFFFYWGLFGSWMLHFLWNFLVIIDYYYKYELSSSLIINIKPKI